jgi:hypothetical protein
MVFKEGAKVEVGVEGFHLIDVKSCWSARADVPDYGMQITVSRLAE